MPQRNFARQKSLRIEELEQRALLAADVYISEIGASNAVVIEDEDGSSADWIEITNAGPDAVDLGGWHLTDDIESLKKWSFPSQQLAPGAVLLVFASDKDRAAAGSQLHTNFKLKSGGEYLGLTRSAGETVEVVSEFTPSFPTQLTDVSYGFGQSVDENIISSGRSAAKLLLPTDDALGTSWTEVGFDDAAWTEATAGVGYQNIVPGFTVQDAKATGRIVNLSEAIAVLDGEGQESSTTVVSPTVNFTDGSPGGFFEGDQPFPNSSGNGDDDFAIRATGVIDLPRSGQWFFGFVSDDGGSLAIDGEILVSDDVLRAPDTSFGLGDFEAGEHEIEVIYFERGGGAELEVFAGHELDEQVQIIGDLENGGLPVFTSGGGAGGISNLYGTDIGEAMQGVSSDAYLRVPFEVADPAAFESLTLRMNHNDGFIAYLNGTEIARSNAPEGPGAANSTATDTRPRGAAESTETLDLTPFLDQLNTGQNVLAIHGLNNAIDDNSFLIRGELAEVKVAKGDAFYFKSPTPGDFNDETGVAGFLTNEITMSQPHGYYEEAFQVELTSATEGTTIRYTLDGSEPTEDNGTDYTAPVTIDKTTTVRARAFKDGVDPSFVETRTYLFLADVVQQTRTTATDLGFPRSAGGQTYNYGMDPDIVDDEVWGPQLQEAFEQIPTMSLVMDVDDFADSDTGIYSNARSHGKAWERPASLELINPDGSEGFQINMGARVRGGFSRTGSNPKHAFRFFFRDEYGDSKLEYPLFGDEGVAEFDKIDLRTSQNYSWAFQGDARNSFVRDVFSRDLQREMEQPYTRSRFYHLYINGQYWGLYQTQERAEARYAASYFGGSADDYDVIKSAGSTGGYANEATDGNMDAYLRLAGAFRTGLGDANREDYMRVQGKNLDGTPNPEYERLLDVENLIDYMIITYFSGDRDGPASRFVQPRVNNYFAIINRENPDGFKFFEHDSEHSLDTGETNMVSPLTFGGQFDEYFNPHWMHEQLAQENVDYRTQFNDRVYEVLFNNGLLTPDNAKALIDSRAQQIDMAVIAESARWGDSKVSQPFTKDHWETAVTSAKRFIERRTSTLLGQLRNVDWYPETDAPGYTVNGKNQHGGEIRPSDLVAFDSAASLEFNKRFIRESSSWRRLDDGSDPGTAWLNSDFDDDEWVSNRGPYGYGEGDERAETSFGDDPADKHFTTYFRKTFSGSDIEQYKSLRLSLLSDDGAVVYLNGTEVIRANMPDGKINFDTSASSKKENGENNFVDYLLPTDLLIEGTNLISVEVHQFANADGKVSDDDMSFDAQLYGGTEIEGEPTEIYYTTDGSDPRLPQGALNVAAIKYNDGFQFDQTTEVRARAKNGDVWGVLTVANFEVQSPSTGDLNNDGELTADDIDALAAAIRENSVDPRFDLNDDNEVNDNDLNYIVESVFKTLPGDTDLDGDVDFVDFLVVSKNFGKQDTGWAEGNFDIATDADTTFADFLALSANFGFGEE